MRKKQNNRDHNNQDKNNKRQPPKKREWDKNMSQNESVFLGGKGGNAFFETKEPNKRGKNKENPRCLCEK